jgi:endonuclease/exonuclease/phosphatase family metal-dependent hydrolase
MKWILLMCAMSALAGEEIRLLSFNVRHGVALDGSPALDRQVAIINRVGAAVVGLQEIDNKCSRSGKVDQAAAFAEKTGTSAHFGKFMDYGGGRYGMAMLSKYEVVSAKNLVLPEGREPRIAIILELVTPQKNRLLVANVHFDWTDTALRKPQAEALLAYLDTQDLPAIVLGDYNAVSGSDTLALFVAAGFRFLEKPKDTRVTFIGNDRGLELDHVAIRDGGKATLQGVSIEVLDEKASDHRPVTAMVSITPKK